MYGIIDFNKIETEPGASSAFAPPEGFCGDYIDFMRKRWKQDPGVRQHVVVVGRVIARGGPVKFCGPFAQEAERIVRSACK